MTTSNIANRLRRLEAVRPKRDEFDHMSADELRAYIGAETRALLAEYGSIEVLLEKCRTAGIETSAEEVVEQLGYGPLHSNEMVQ